MVKEHTQKEYEEYLATLKNDSEELKLARWTFRLAMEAIDTQTIFPTLWFED